MYDKKYRLENIEEFGKHNADQTGNGNVLRDHAGVFPGVCLYAGHL